MADKKFFYEEVEKIRDVVEGCHEESPPLPPWLGGITMRTEEEDLDDIRDDVYEHLRKKKAPPTCRNIIHAMFEMHYADWIGHDDCVPTCPYEHQEKDK